MKSIIIVVGMIVVLGLFGFGMYGFINGLMNWGWLVFLSFVAFVGVTTYQKHLGI